MILEDPNFEKKIVIYVIVGVFALITSILFVVYL